VVCADKEVGPCAPTHLSLQRYQNRYLMTYVVSPSLSRGMREPALAGEKGRSAGSTLALQAYRARSAARTLGDAHDYRSGRARGANGIRGGAANGRESYGRQRRRIADGYRRTVTTEL